MPKVLEKIKSFFSGKYVYRAKCSTSAKGGSATGGKNEEPQPKADQPLADKAEEKPEEQK